MDRILIVAVLALVVTNASAATCRNEAADKHLAGAALTSFMGKCGRDAKASCEATAEERKIFGAARTSFTKKCVNDAVGE
jgi:hypothetical protein